MTRWRIFSAVAITAFAADQATKLWARHTLPVDPGGRAIPVPVIPGYFDFVLAYNKGSAFSLVSGSAGWMRVGLALVALLGLAAILWIVARARDEDRLLAVTLGLMASGTLGNLVDRVIHGRVTDFIFWHWHEHTWPIFNVADACLSVSVGLFLIHAWRLRSRTRQSDL